MFIRKEGAPSYASTQKGKKISRRVKKKKSPSKTEPQKGEESRAPPSGKGISSKKKGKSVGTPRIPRFLIGRETARTSSPPTSLGKKRTKKDDSFIRGRRKAKLLVINQSLRELV